MESSCVSLKRLLNSIYIIKPLKYIFLEYSYSVWVCLDLSCFVLIGRVAQQRWKYISTRRFLYIFCLELLLFVKKPTGMGFSSLQNVFSTFSLDIIVLANFVEKNPQFAHPATARNSLPQESATSQNALINPPFCGDKIFTLEIGAGILCLLSLWLRSEPHPQVP